MYLLNTVASRFLFQLRWFISDWLCYDSCAQVIWWMIQFWSAWSNHDDEWHVRDVHFPRLFWFKYAWMCFLYVRNTQLTPPRWLADTRRYMVQVIHRFLELLVLSAWSLGEKLMFRTEQDEITRSCIIPIYLQILIGYDVRSSFLIVFFSTLSQLFSHGDGRVTEN